MVHSITEIKHGYVICIACTPHHLGQLIFSYNCFDLYMISYNSCKSFHFDVQDIFTFLY